MLTGFRDFILRGNVLELAVAVVIGAAFGAVVDALVKGLIDPLLAAATPGEIKDINNALVVGPFRFGLILSAIISFIAKAFVVYFFIVRPFSNMAARYAPTAAPTADQVLLTEIRDLLARGR